MPHSKWLSVLLLCCAVSYPAYAERTVPAWNQAEAAQTTGAIQMTPAWANQATIQLKNLITRSSKNIAASIQGITHPTGNGARLGNFNVLNLGDHMMVQMVVHWNGGVLGTAYQTSVNWELDPNQHLVATVSGDTASISVQPQNLQALDNYFRQNVYPVFFSNMNAVSRFWK